MNRLDKFLKGKVEKKEVFLKPAYKEQMEAMLIAEDKRRRRMLYYWLLPVLLIMALFIYILFKPQTGTTIDEAVINKELTSNERAVESESPNGSIADVEFKDGNVTIERSSIPEVEKETPGQDRDAGLHLEQIPESLRINAEDNNVGGKESDNAPLETEAHTFTSQLDRIEEEKPYNQAKTGIISIDDSADPVSSGEESGMRTGMKGLPVPEMIPGKVHEAEEVNEISIGKRGRQKENLQSARFQKTTLPLLSTFRDFNFAREEKEELFAGVAPVIVKQRAGFHIRSHVGMMASVSPQRFTPDPKRNGQGLQAGFYYQKPLSGNLLLEVVFGIGVKDGGFEFQKESVATTFGFGYRSSVNTLEIMKEYYLLTEITGIRSLGKHQFSLGGRANFTTAAKGNVSIFTDDQFSGSSISEAKNEWVDIAGTRLLSIDAKIGYGYRFTDRMILEFRGIYAGLPWIKKRKNFSDNGYVYSGSQKRFYPELAFKYQIK
jgi:hypothetical protein